MRDRIEEMAYLVDAFAHAVASSAEQALAALKRMSSPTALVRRDGRVVEIESSQIVPGDIVILEAGRVRLRPIIMTTATTVLGLLPMARKALAAGGMCRPFG